jgi:hypothetical protein
LQAKAHEQLINLVKDLGWAVLPMLCWRTAKNQGGSALMSFTLAFHHEDQPKEQVDKVVMRKAGLS